MDILCPLSTTRLNYQKYLKGIIVFLVIIACMEDVMEVPVCAQMVVKNMVNITLRTLSMVKHIVYWSVILVLVCPVILLTEHV
jgi:hypothetical protein